MKKVITIILLFYILFCAIVPCFFFDHCAEEEQAVQTVPDKQEKDCNNCSPFAICAVTPGLTINSISSSPAPVILYHPPLYAEFDPFFQSHYTSGHFQPPRMS